MLGSKSKATASPRHGVTHGQNRFSTVPSVSIERSVFNRSCGLTTTLDSGFLVPIYADEALPGDTFNVRMSSFGRMATPLRPVMDNIFMDYFFFAVPIRLIWDNWQKMNGEQINPGDSTEFLVPQVSAPVGGWGEHSIADYLGIPTKVEITHSALWHRAYNLIFNEWFRSQDLVDSVVVNRDDGPDPDTDYTLLRRGKRHDYFTSCLPFPQKGQAVELPLGTSAPVTIASSGDGEPVFAAGATTAKINVDATAPHELEYLTDPSGDQTLAWSDPKLGGTVDLSSATAATINQIREAFQIQRLFERDARGGTRYTEVIRSHFGVVSPDQRLQRPEYLGGGTTTINVNPVSTTISAPGAPLGELGAFITTTGNGIGFNKSFVEHCVIIGLVNVRADLHYQQGLDRMFSRRTRFDFYWPAFARLGEQAVLNKEIFADGSAADDQVFGYQERFAEYRYKPSRVTGQMRSNAATPLDVWHLSQDFAALPVLDETFIEENPPISRVVAVPSEPEFLLDLWFDGKTARPMPVNGVPGMIDHF